MISLCSTPGSPIPPECEYYSTKQTRGEVIIRLGNRWREPTSTNIYKKVGIERQLAAVTRLDDALQTKTRAA